MENVTHLSITIDELSPDNLMDIIAEIHLKFDGLTALKLAAYVGAKAMKNDFFRELGDLK